MMSLGFIPAVARTSTSLLYIIQWHSIIWMWHIFFIYLQVDEHLACCHFLAIMNNAVMNTGVQVFCRHMLSCILSRYLEVEMLGHMATLCLTF